MTAAEAGRKRARSRVYWERVQPSFMGPNSCGTHQNQALSGWTGLDKFPLCRERLHAKRGTAATRALHVRVFELETRALQRFDVINRHTLQIHERSCVDKHLKVIEAEGFVHHAGAVLEGHRVGESRASAADYAHAQSYRYRILLRHNLFDLGDGRAGECYGLGFNTGCCRSRCRGYGCHSFSPESSAGL